MDETTRRVLLTPPTQSAQSDIKPGALPFFVVGLGASIRLNAGLGPRLQASIALAALATAFLLAPLPAQAIYRCNVQGTLSYSDLPCAEGSQDKTLAPASTADESQAREARRKLERQQDQLQRLQTERERKAAAWESARARAEAGRQAHDKRCKLMELKTRWSAEDAAQAGIKQQERAKRTARRHAEQYQLECGASR